MCPPQDPQCLHLRPYRPVHLFHQSEREQVSIRGTNGLSSKSVIQLMSGSGMTRTDVRICYLACDVLEISPQSV
jgi:hypothetical protein